MFTLGLKETCGQETCGRRPAATGDLRQRRDRLRHGSRLSGATLVDSKHEVCTGVLIFNQSTEQVPNDG
jgi:hypothetical protein